MCEIEAGGIKAITLLQLGTDGAQSLLLKGVLATTDETDLHKSVIVQCIGDTGYQSLPLHRVCRKSRYVSGDVTVDFIDKIPIDGVDMFAWK